MVGPVARHRDRALLTRVAAALEAIAHVDPLPRLLAERLPEMAVLHVEQVPVLGFVERASFDTDREARLLGLLPLPVAVPPALVSTNFAGDTAVLDPSEEPWRFEGPPKPL
jgi:hypothetical protein